MAMDYYLEATEIADCLDRGQWTTEATALRDALENGSTATEILMGLSWNLRRIETANLPLNPELRARIRCLLAAIASALKT